MLKDFTRRDLKADVEIREDSGKKTIYGLIPYNSRSQYMGFYEYIAPTAFNKTLADGSDVRALMNHDSDKLLGRVKNGSLRLHSEEDGLHIECDLPDTSYARDVYELIKAGYNNGLSFGMRIIQQDYGTEKEGDLEVTTHTLKEVRLYEVSFAVSFPAYEATNSEARSLRGIDLDNFRDVLAKEEITEGDKDALREIITKLEGIIKPEEPSTTPAEDLTRADAEVENQLDSILERLNKIN